MKKLVLTLTALAAFTGPTVAADMAPRTYAKAAPMPVAVATWTGCYIGGGGGYGLWSQENIGYIDVPRAPVRTQFTDTFTNSGRGWFGTVQGGCDYQFAGSQFVIGLDADYDFADIKGRMTDVLNGGIGNEKLRQQWSVGGRIGYLITPNLLTYFSGGYTEAQFDSINFTNLQGPPFGIPTGVLMHSNTYKGWYLGAGDEYALSFLPGLFWKTEYRFSEFGGRTNRLYDSTTGSLLTDSYDSKKWVQTVRSELVYRFNWGGSVVAKY